MSQRPSQKRPCNYALQLKRSYTDHKHLHKDPFVLDKQFNRTRQITTTTLSARLKPDSQTQPKYKQSSIDSDFTQPSISQSWTSEEGIDRFQERINEAMNLDLKESIHAKERTNYGNRYEERDDSEFFWISQPKWIPREVQREYSLCQQELKPGEKINFFQGFLNQVGFMYYAVERKVYFYDIQTLNEDSVCSQIIQTEQKLIDVFYGIQMMQIGPPYLTTTRKVLVFFHYQEAELYHFTVARDYGKNQRKIQIKYLNVSFTLQQTKPNKLVLTDDGVLYYTDSKGTPKKVETDHSFINKTISNITHTSRKMTKNFKDFLQNTTKNIAKSVVTFSKVVFNFSRSLFSKRSFTTDIVSDPHHSLIITYYCEQLAKQQLRQQLKVYSSKDQMLLYTIEEDDFLDKYSKNDYVIKIKVIERKVNNDYSLLLLLDSGKRVFLDLTQQYLKKSIMYQPHPTTQIKYYGEQSQHKFSIESSVLEERFYSTLLYADNSFSFSFVRYTCDRNDARYEAVSKLIVQIHGGPRQNQYYMFSRQLEELGPIKSCLLSCENQWTHPKDMSFEVQEVFYRPQEIVHASDKMAQRIVILRPVDILFTLVIELKNIFQIQSGIKISFNEIEPKNIIGYCCQILLDEEGAYYVSKKLATSIKDKLTIRREQFQRSKNQQLQEILFNDLSKQTKNRVEELIIDLIKTQNMQKEEVFLSGVIYYLAKLFRPIWNTSVNQLKSQACKHCLSIIQTVEQLINKFKKRLRLSNNGIVNGAFVWLKKLWQLLFLIKTIPTLPQCPLNEVISLSPSDLHEYIFTYLIKYCEPKMLQQLKRSTPIYINDQFVKNFKFWLTLQGLKTKEQKIALCKEQPSLPGYLIDKILSISGLEDIKPFFEGQRTSPDTIHKYFTSLGSYKKIIHCLKEASDTLIAKEILLEKARDMLKEEAKHDEMLFQEGMAEIAQIHSQIHLQRLLKEYYLENKQLSNSWKDMLFKVANRQSSSQLSVAEEINFIFETELFDIETITPLIESAKDPLLDIALANYYFPNQVVDKLQQLIVDTQNKVSNVRQLPSIYTHQIQYLLTKAKIQLAEQVLIKIYIQKISEIGEIIRILKEDNGILERQVYFTLSCLARISADTQNIWKWARRTLNQLDKTSNFFKYLSACTTYFVKDYLPGKKQQFCEFLAKIHPNEDLFQKMRALLLQEGCTK